MIKKYIIIFSLLASVIWAKEPELTTQEGVKEFIEDSRVEFRKQMEHFTTLVDEEPIDQSLEALNQAGTFLISRLAILNKISEVTDDTVVIREGLYGFWRLLREISPKMWVMSLNKFNNHAFTETSLTPFTSSILKGVLGSLGIKAIPQKRIPSYTYQKGDVEEALRASKDFSLLTLNVCFAQDYMPTVFGGMPPWRDRLDLVSDLILEADADVICLQEVFDPEANTALYHKLKGTYAHFYMLIKPRCFNFSWRSIGLGSGLFVASKYPLKNPDFYPFKKGNSYINRGLFSFEVASNSTDSQARIFFTHLEPFKEGKALRQREIEQVIRVMKKSSADKDIPHILCGDLNLDLRKGEEAEGILMQHFIDPVHSKVQEVNFENCTSNDFTLYEWDPKRYKGTPQILDYILLLKSDQEPMVQSKKIKAFDENPARAASDHHALKADFFYDERVYEPRNSP